MDYDIYLIVLGRILYGKQIIISSNLNVISHFQTLKKTVECYNLGDQIAHVAQRVA